MVTLLKVFKSLLFLSQESTVGISVLPQPLTHKLSYLDHQSALWDPIVSKTIFAVDEDEFVADVRHNFGVIFSAKVFIIRAV